MKKIDLLASDEMEPWQMFYNSFSMDDKKKFQTGFIIKKDRDRLKQLGKYPGLRLRAGLFNYSGAGS